MSASNKKFYTDVQIKSDIIIDNATTGTVPVIDGSKKIKSSTVTSTELGQLSGVTSPIQTQINSEVAARIAADALNIPLTQKGAINGVATLDGSGKLTAGQVPAIAISDTFVVASQAAMLALVAQTGDVAVRTDLSKSFILQGSDPTILAGWQELLTPVSPVQSVNGQTGTVVLTTTNINEGTNQYFTDERAQDAVGTILTNTNTVDFTYNDAANTIIADVKTQQSITSDASGIKLSGDSAAPGNAKYYGTNGSGTKGYFSIPVQGSPGDIQEASFSLTNNQTSFADITGLAFSNGVVRSFKAVVSVFIDASSDVFERFELDGIQRGADWAMSVESEGDDSGIVFSITSAGQIQYTSSSSAGFTSGVMKFRATTTSI